jgi:dipeptidyl aminopeptidase/acylaminoacyl peptidase
MISLLGLRAIWGETKVMWSGSASAAKNVIAAAHVDFLDFTVPPVRAGEHARREGDEESLWLRQVARRSDMQVLPPGPGFHGLTFSPDDNSIYFVRSDEKDPYFKYLYSMPTLGGIARKLITDVDSPVTFSPDGHRFAYEHCIQPRNGIELKIANADGSGDHLLATIHDGSGFLFQPGPNWSRDGRAPSPFRFIS